MPPYRIEWLDEARVDVRRLDRPTALFVFDGILHYARTGAGDASCRLRPGFYRVLFTMHEDTMRIFGVRHRGKAYRR